MTTKLISNGEKVVDASYDVRFLLVSRRDTKKLAVVAVVFVFGVRRPTTLFVGYSFLCSKIALFAWIVKQMASLVGLYSTLDSDYVLICLTGDRIAL